MTVDPKDSQNEMNTPIIPDVTTTPPSQDIPDYISAVEKLAAAKDPWIFKNSSPTHAAVVLTTMLKYCKESFCIYDNDLSGDVANKYDKFYPSLISFVQAGNLVRIVIDNAQNQDERMKKILTDLKSQFPDKIYISLASEPFKTAVTNTFKTPLNFAVGDNDAFRLEEIDTKKGKENRKAICSFNNKEIAGSLRNTFDNHFQDCVALYN